MQLVTFNIASLDGRIAVSGSTPAWLDPKWKPLEHFEPVDVMALHKTRLSLQGSNSFTARSAGAADFGDYAGREVPAGDFLPSSLRSHEGRWLIVVDSRARVRRTTFQMKRHQACSSARSSDSWPLPRIPARPRCALRRGRTRTG